MGMDTRPKHYWQLPVFMTGLVAAYAAYMYSPAKKLDTSKADLAELVAALERKPIDAAAVEPILKKLSDHPHSTSANYLMGSGYIALAELAPTEADDYWHAAAKLFANCDPNKLDNPNDAQRLAFRQAKALAATKAGDPLDLIRALSAAPIGEDKSECARLIADSAMRLTPPDFKVTKEQLTTYLSSPNKASATALANAKLQLAKLHLDARESTQARQWLKDIGTSVPAEIAQTVNVELGRLAIEDKNWSEAAKLLQTAVDSNAIPKPDQSSVRYFLGVAQEQLGNSADARRHFEQVAQEPGKYGSIAAMKLARAIGLDPMAKGQRGNAAEMLEKAVVQANALEPNDTRELRYAFEQVIETTTAEGDFASAMRAAQAYTKVSDGTRDKLHRAEIQSKWAEELMKAGKSTEAQPKLLAAAAEYVGLAENERDLAERGKFLRSATRAFQRGGQLEKASEIVSTILNTPGFPDTMVGQAWLDHADLLPADKDAEIETALKNAMAKGGPAATTARYKLGVNYVKRGYSLRPSGDTAQADGLVKLGRNMLAQIADAANISTPEQATHEEAIFELGKQAMQEGQFGEAENRLRKLVSLYPQGTHADNARLWLASALLNRSRSDATAAPKARTEALMLLKELSNSPDPFMKTWGEIWTANTMLQMGDTSATIGLCEKLLLKHQGKMEELVVGRVLFGAHMAQSTSNRVEAEKTLNRMDIAFQKLPRDAFRNDGEYSYTFWKSELPRLRELLKPVPPSPR